jgi:hypothetical protein
MGNELKRHCYVISYDLAGEGAYDELIDAIKSFGTWAHITESTWAVVTEKTHKELRDELAGHLPDGSRLFVVRSGSIAAWSNVMCKNEWLKKYL